MAFSDVTFAFKQVITSAKLNQLMENIRTHDHISTGQGDKFGRIGGAGTGTNVSSTTTTPTSVVAASVVVPAGITGARRLQIAAVCRVRQDSGGVGNIRGHLFEGTTDVYDFGALAIPNAGVVYGFSWTAPLRPIPAAGTITYSLRLSNTSTGGWTFFSGAIDVFIV